MIDFKKLAKEYDTPLYIYDFDKIEERYNSLKEAFRARKSIICYAVKANSNLSLMKHFAKIGSGADCVSIGEVKRALYAGISKYKIVFSGVGKSDDEIKEALKEDILMINLESEGEFDRIEKIASKMKKIARISIRVNPNIDPKTHSYISTGLHENKFGIDIPNAKRLYIRAKNSEFIDSVGIHFHIGSQLTELEPIKEASEAVSDMLRSLKSIDIDIKFFDVGGGLGIRYENETTINPYDYAQAIFSTLGGLDVTVITEPGRFLVGDNGYFLTKVLYEKINEDKRFVITDGAMNDFLRPSLYEAYHDIEVIGKNTKEDDAECDLVGPVCESRDFFAKNRKIPQTQHNDLVVIKDAGAYGFSMSSNYNTRPRVAEVAIQKGSDRLIRKRENFEDMIRLEKEFLN